MEMILEEKINRLREIVKELEKYDKVLFLYEGDRIDISMLKSEMWDILKTL